MIGAKFRPKLISCTECVPGAYWFGIATIHYNFNDFFETTCHNQPNIVTSATWKQLVGLCDADGTPTVREPTEIFAKPLRILEEQPNTAWNDPGTPESSDNFLDILEFVHKTGVSNDYNNPGNLMENLV